MYYGLEALVHGALAAVIVLLPALWAFWRLTRGIAGARAARPFVAACAAYGVAVGAAGAWAMAFERPRYVEDAMGGAMITGGAVALIGFAIMLVLPRRA